MTLTNKRNLLYSSLQAENERANDDSALIAKGALLHCGVVVGTSVGFLARQKIAREGYDNECNDSFCGSSFLRSGWNPSTIIYLPFSIYGSGRLYTITDTLS